MQNIIDINNLNYTYPASKTAALRDINLTVRKGEFVLVTGPTGCGKTTLFKTLNGIIPHESGGDFSGCVTVDGFLTSDVTIFDLCRKVGLVFQSPDDQLFSTVVEDEIAFGMENLNIPTNEMNTVIDEVLERVGLGGFRHRNVNELSGGQKQRLAIASVLALKPAILALDEPTAQLDPRGSVEIMRLIKTLNEEFGITVMCIEHRSANVAHNASRIVVMDEGAIVLDRPAKEAFKSVDVFARLGIEIPQMAYVSNVMNLPEVHFSAEEVAQEIAGEGLQHTLEKHLLPLSTSGKQATGEVIVQAENVHFSYRKKSPVVLENIDLMVRRGEFVAIMGANGSGKSTLLQLLSGCLKPTGGTLAVCGWSTRAVKMDAYAGKVGIVFQNPDLMLVCDSVAAEIALGPQRLKKPKEHIERLNEYLLEAMVINDLAAEAPFALSRGQRLRVAIASVLAMEPMLVLLDEPTTGQDRKNIDNMMRKLKELEDDRAVVFCTHDVPTALKFAARIIVLNEGKIILDAPTSEVARFEDVFEKASLVLPDVFTLTRRLGIGPYFDVTHSQEVRR